MKTRVHLRLAIVLVTCSTLVAAPALHAAEELEAAANAGSRAPILDVKLTEQGLFHGQLVTRAGQAVRRQKVELTTKGGTVAGSTSDSDGRFTFQPPQPGVYQLVAPHGGCVLRIWTHAAAPPSAQGHILLVQDTVVRGQHGHGHGQMGVGSGLYDGGVMKALSNPWVFSGIVAAGIAVPIAIAANDNDNDSGS
jgi:hypothetical protein